MKLRRVKFVWGAPQIIRGRWFGGLVGRYDRGEAHRGVAISVRGLLLWSAGLALVAYLAGATALFWLWNRNPYSMLTYSDAILYPFRRAQISEKKGQAFIAQGQDLYRAKRYMEAINLLRIGLSRYPRDFRARLTLAQFYMLTNQRPLALQTLLEGLTDEYPGRAFLETLFNAAEMGEDYERVESTAVRYLPYLRREGPATDLRWLGERRFAALTAAQRYEDALKVAEADGQTHSGMERQVLALLLLGRPEDAIARLSTWRTQPGAQAAVIARLEVRAFREAKRFEDMERALEELRVLNPSDAAPRVYAVIQQAMAGRIEAARAALEDYLFRFGGTAENLLLVATPLAEIGDLPLLKRCVTAAAERGFPKPRFQILLVQASVSQGAWAEAAATLAALPPETGREAIAANAWRDWMKFLIEAARAPSDPAQSALLEFLRSRPWPTRIFRQSVEALLRADRLETVRDVLVLGERGFPQSEWLRAQKADVQAKIEARAAAVAAAAVPAGVNVIGEHVFFKELNEYITAKDWTAAEKQARLAAQMRPLPHWVAKREADLRLAQVRIDIGHEEIPALMASARLFLNGDDERARRIMEIAREMDAAGNRATALMLAKEVMRKSPRYAPARRAVAEWEPVKTDAKSGSDTSPASDRPVAGSRSGGVDPLEAVRSRQAAGDVPGMLTAARQFLNGEQVRSQQVLEVAREFYEKADRNAANLLVREVLRRTPNFPPAVRLAQEWESAAKK